MRIFARILRLRSRERFNFAYDVMDVLAEKTPDKRALVWCNDKGEERIFTYRDLSLLSSKAANAFASLGIGKGDTVMMILKRRYHFGYCL